MNARSWGFRIAIAAVLTFLAVLATPAPGDVNSPEAAPAQMPDLSITATGSRSPRKLEDRFAEIANVLDYGAVGDWREPAGVGATDNTAAFQAAIDSGKPVYVPPGVYYVGKSLVLPVAPAAVKIFGDNQRYSANGRRGTTHIHTSATLPLFIPSVPSTSAGLSVVYVQLHGLSFQAPWQANTVFFNDVQLSGSEIDSCLIQGFQSFLYGQLVGVSHVHHNFITGLGKGLVVPSTTMSPSPPAVMDSVISDNYIGGRTQVSDVTLIDLAGGSTTSITNNYFDFAYQGIVGQCFLCTIQSNTFDVIFRAIKPGSRGYGGLELNIIGNRFFNIRKTASSYFSSPTREMLTDDWVAIYLGQGARGITVIGNTIRNSDRFMVMPEKWYRDIKEYGNVGVAGFTGPLVVTAGRAVNDPGWASLLAGRGSEAADGTGLDFASRRRRVAAAYGPSVAIDCDLGDHFVITVTDGAAFAIANPQHGYQDQRLRITLRNGSGAALGSVEWGNAFKLAEWRSPRPGYSRSIEFVFDGTNWVEMARTPADVPN